MPQPDRAVVLERHPGPQERDRVVLLCPSRGKVGLWVRAVARSRRRFPSGLSTAMWGQAQWAPAGKKLGLEGFEVQAPHLQLARDLQAFAAAAYACELSSRALAPGIPTPRIFLLLWELLGRLAQGEFPGFWLRCLELALLLEGGWIADAQLCSGRSDACAPGPRRYLDPKSGSLDCPAHQKAGALRLDATTATLLCDLQASLRRETMGPFDGAAQSFAQQPPAVRRQLRQLCWRWIDEKIDPKLRSRAVLLELAGISAIRG